MKIYECLSSKTNTYLNYFYTDPLDIIRTKNLAEGQKLAWFSKDKLKKLKRSPDVLIFEEYLN